MGRIATLAVWRRTAPSRNLVGLLSSDSERPPPESQRAQADHVAVSHRLAMARRSPDGTAIAAAATTAIAATTAAEAERCAEGKHMR